MSSDTRLARRASEGDERAFAAIFRRYHQDLYRYCLAILGNPEDAQDALQNTMLSALRALPGERREIELKPWLYRIAHNESIDLVRRRRAGESLDPELAAAGPGLAQEAEARERLGKLLADLEQLPERQRGALLMRELGGLGFEQIGTALGCTAAVARQTTYEARLGLRQFEAGREMDCVAVTKALSDADGRVARRRDIRAHLRDCPGCTAFQAEIKGRTRDLAALSPLPAALGAALLQGVLGGGGGAAGGGGVAGALGAGAAKTAAGSIALKATATVAVVAALGVGADRADLVDLGLPGGAAKQAPAGAEVAPVSETVAAEPAGPAAATGPARGSAAAAGKTAIADRATAAAGKSRGAEEPAQAPAAAAAEQPAAQAPGRSKSRGQGTRPALPAASAHGQQTAAAHKNSSHGRSAEHAAKPAPAAQPTHPAKPAKPATPATAKAPPDPGNSAAAAPPAEKPDPGTGNGKKPAE